MRIVAGEYRSRTIKAPRGTDTRPTLDQTREALFNILQGRVEGRDFLDLYAGSGAVALEALSRGARYAVLCDMSREACRCISDNIRALGCTDKTRLMHMRDSQALQELARENRTFDLIYLDPPYVTDLSPVLSQIVMSGLAAPGGLVIAEHDTKHTPVCPEGLTLDRSRTYRDTVLSFFRRTAEDEDLSVSGQL